MNDKFDPDWCRDSVAAETIREHMSIVKELHEALHHAMIAWEYDGISEEHGAIATECMRLLRQYEGIE